MRQQQMERITNHSNINKNTISINTAATTTTYTAVRLTTTTTKGTAAAVAAAAAILSKTILYVSFIKYIKIYIIIKNQLNRDVQKEKLL